MKKPKLTEIQKRIRRFDKAIKRALNDRIAFGWADEDKEFTGLALTRVLRVVLRAYKEGVDDGAGNPYC